MGPVGELDFRDQLGLRIVDTSVALNFPEEGITICLECLQAFPHRGMGFCGETAARLANGNQSPLIVIKPEHDRAKAFPRAARLGVSTDYTFLPADNLDLQPLAASFLHITTAATFGNDAL